MQLTVSGGFTVRNTLTVLNDQGEPLGISDNALGNGSNLKMNVEAGQKIFVRIDSRLGGTGNYTLGVVTGDRFLDDVGSNAESSTLVPVSSAGAIQARGKIDNPGDVDWFRFTAPSSGQFTVKMSASGASRLQPAIDAFNSNLISLAFQEARQGEGSVTVRFGVVAGQAYYLAARGLGIDSAAMVGDYQFSSSLATAGVAANDDYAGTIQGAAPIKLNKGQGELRGVLENSADTDMFKFTVPAAGRMLVRLSYGSSVPAARLTMLGVDGRETGTLVDTGTKGLWEYTAEGGKEVYLRLDSLGEGDQSYTLSIAADEETGIAQLARVISPDAAGAVLDGAIQLAGDADLLAVDTTLDGRLIARLDPRGSIFATRLEILDQSGRVLTTGTLDAQFRQQANLVVTPGQRYFVRVTGDDGATGRYQLQVRQIADDQPDLPSLAKTDLQLAQSTTGAVQFDGDSDVFRFTADQSGDFIFQAKAGSGKLDPRISIIDANGNELGFNDNGGQGTAALLGLTLESGQTVYVKVGGKPGGGSGNYELLVTSDRIADGDDYADTLRLALKEQSSLLSLADGSGSVEGSINRTDDIDLFRLVVPSNGRFEILVKASGGLNPRLDLLDATGRLVAGDDAGGQGVDAFISRVLTGGDQIFLKIQGLSDTIGGYSLEFRPFQTTGQTIPDDVGDSVEQAKALNLNADGIAVFDGNIEVGGDVDYFTVAVAESGSLLIDLGTSGTGNLDTILYAKASATSQWEVNDNVRGSTASRVVLDVKAGDIVQVKATGFGTTTGKYALKLEMLPPVPDDFTNNLADPEPLESNLTGNQSGEIESVGDRDLFVYTPSEDGFLTVALERVVGSGLNPQLRLLDTQGNILVQDNDSGVGVNSLAQVRVRAGVPVLIQAGSALANTGKYQLAWSLSTDDFGDTAGSAQELDVTNNLFEQDGRLGTSSDNDWFVYVADREGLVTFRMEPTNSNETLDPYLFVLDGSMAIMGSSSRVDGGKLAEVSIQVSAGQVFYLQTASLGRTMGDYRLSSTAVADDYGSSKENAFELELDGQNRLADLEGAVDISLDRDWFQIVAQADGRVRMSLTGVDEFDPAILVVDADGRIVAANDDFGGSADSRVDLRLKANEVYYIEASGFGSSEGAYVLRIDDIPDVADDYGDTSDLASALFPDQLGVTSGSGNLGHDTDNDYLRLIPAKSGTAVLNLTASSELGGSARVRIYTLLDGKQVQIGSAQGSAVLKVSFPVTAGQDIFVRIDSPKAGMGSYSFDVQIAEVSSGDRPIDSDTLRAISDEFNRAFIQRISAMLNPSDIYDVQKEIAKDLVNSYLAASGLPSGNVLLIFLDPVDFVAEDPSGRQVGQTTGSGTIMENGAASVSSRGALDLVVIPNAQAGQFQMQLLGVGGGRVMAGATMLTKDGSTINPAVSMRGQAISGNIPVGEVPKQGLQLVLDFRNGAGNDTGGSGSPGNTGGTTGTGSNTGEAGSGGAASTGVTSVVGSTLANSTLVQTLAGLTNGFGADLASIGTQVTQSLTNLMIVATTGVGGKSGDDSVLGKMMAGEDFQRSILSAVTITQNVASAIYRTGDYLVRSLPRTERILIGSLAPARQLANATLLPAVRETIGKVLGDAASATLKQADAVASTALSVFAKSAAKIPGVAAPKKAADSLRSEAPGQDDRTQTIAHLFAPGDQPDTVMEQPVEAQRAEDSLWRVIGTLSEKAQNTNPAVLPLAPEVSVEHEAGEKKRLAGLAAAMLLAPSWAAAIHPDGDRNKRPASLPPKRDPKEDKKNENNS